MNVATLEAIITVDPSDLERGLDTADRRIEETGEKAKKTGDRFEELAKQGDKLKNLGTILSAGLTVPIVGLGAASLNSAMELSSLRRGLTAVAGSSEAAERQLVSLREVAKLPGLGLQEAIQGSTNLQAVGYNAQLSERALKAFGNALATVGKGRAELQGVIVALSQIESKGKVSAEEINQIAERVPQIRKAMKDAFGTADTMEIQKMGISTQQFVEKMVTSLEKLPQINGEAKESFEDLQDTVFIALSEIGETLLPTAKLFTDMLIPVVRESAHAFASLPEPVRGGIVVLAGVTATAGPLLFTMGLMAKSLKDVKEGWEVARSAGTIFTNFLKAKTATTVADTLAETASTGAKAASVGADAAVLASEKTVEMARRSHTKALWDEYFALEANTKAEMANAMAVQASAESVAAGQAVRAGGLARNLGGAPGVAGAARLFGGPVGVVTAGIVGGYSLAALQDKMAGREDPGIGATLDHLNPFRQEDPALAAPTSRRESRAALTAMGETPRQAIIRQQKEAAAKRQEEADRAAEQRQGVEEAQYEADLQKAKAQASIGGKEGKEGREAALMAPIVEAREKAVRAHAEKLKREAGEDVKKQEAALKELKEADQLREKALDLRNDAAEESRKAAEKAAKKITEAARKERESHNRQLDAWVKGQRARLAEANPDGDSDKAAISEAQMMNPVLAAKQADIVRQMNVLRSSKDPHAQEEIDRLGIEWQELELEKFTNASRAARAEKNLQKKAGQEALKSWQLRHEIAKDQAMAIVQEAQQGTQARAAKNELIPLLREEQQSILADLAKFAPGSLEYLKAEREYWAKEREIKKLEKDANKEVQDEAKKAQSEGKRQRHEMLQVLNAQYKLAEAQMEENPFLTDRQKKERLVPLLIQQYKEMTRPVEGETQLEALQRQTEAQQLRNQALENATGGRENMKKVLGGGRLPLFNARAYQSTLRELNSADENATVRQVRRNQANKVVEAEGHRMARETAPGRPLVVQVLGGTIMDRRALKQEILRAADEAAEQAFPGVAADY